MRSIDIIRQSTLQEYFHQLITLLNDENCTPLHSAVIAGNNDAVNLMLPHISCQRLMSMIALREQSNGNTVMHRCASIGSGLESARAIIELIPDHQWVFLNLLNIQNERDSTPLHLACEHGYLDTFSFMISLLGAQNRTLLTKHGFNRDNILHCNLFGNNSNDEGVRKIYEAIEPNEFHSLLFMTNDHGQCPLHIASRTGNVSALKFLLGKVSGDDIARLVYITDNDSENVLHACAYSQNMIQMFDAIAKRIDREHLVGLIIGEEGKGHSFIHSALEQVRVCTAELSRLILFIFNTILETEERSKSSIIRQRDCNTGRTPLHYAALCGLGDVMKYILDQLSSNEIVATAIQKNEGRFPEQYHTLLHDAVLGNEKQRIEHYLCQAITEGGRGLGVQKFETELLYLAVPLGYEKLSRQLLDRYSQSELKKVVVQRNINGSTLLAIIATSQLPDIAKVIIKKLSEDSGILTTICASVAKQCMEFLLPMLWEYGLWDALKNHSEQRKELLNLKDWQGNTMLHFAMQKAELKRYLVNIANALVELGENIYDNLTCMNSAERTPVEIALRSCKSENDVDDLGDFLDHFESKTIQRVIERFDPRGMNLVSSTVIDMLGNIFHPDLDSSEQILIYIWEMLLGQYGNDPSCGALEVDMQGNNPITYALIAVDSPCPFLIAAQKSVDSWFLMKRYIQQENRNGIRCLDVWSHKFTDLPSRIANLDKTAHSFGSAFEISKHKSTKIMIPDFKWRRSKNVMGQWNGQDLILFLSGCYGCSPMEYGVLMQFTMTPQLQFLVSGWWTNVGLFITCHIRAALWSHH